MILLLVQFATIAGIAHCLLLWRKGVKRRNSETWDSLLARLRPEWSARGLSDHFLWKEGLSATPEDVWERMEGPKGLWTMFQNARVMLEMADYAARNGDGVDALLLATLRSDAMHIRLCVLLALGQYVFPRPAKGFASIPIARLQCTRAWPQG